MRKPQVIAGRLDTSMLEAVRYLLHTHGCMSEETVATLYVATFPGAVAPASFRSFMSANASVGRLSRPAPGMYHVAADYRPDVTRAQSLDHPSATARIVSLLETQGPLLLTDICRQLGLVDRVACERLVYAAAARGLIHRVGVKRYAAPTAAAGADFRNRLPFNAMAAVAEIVKANGPIALADVYRIWMDTHRAHLNYNVSVALARAKKAGLIVSAGRGRYAAAVWPDTSVSIFD